MNHFNFSTTSYHQRKAQQRRDRELVVLEYGSPILWKAIGGDANITNAYRIKCVLRSS